MLPNFFSKKEHVNIIGLMRIRNEELILKDSLDHFSNFVDKIIIFDDCSNDNSVKIAEHHPKVIKIIKNKLWKKNRIYEETKNRATLLKEAKKYHPKWIFYADCDERFDGKIKEFLLSSESNNIEGIKIKLFDAYITPDDKKSYKKGKLLNFRKYFGPEKREILMIWRNNDKVKYKGIDCREPIFDGKFITKFHCQHYGKSLSIKHWEETCSYYSTYFPEPYKTKWKNRKGKAIHLKSDFKCKLLTWENIKNIK